MCIIIFFFKGFNIHYIHICIDFNSINKIINNNNNKKNFLKHYNYITTIKVGCNKTNELKKGNFAK